LLSTGSHLPMPPSYRRERPAHKPSATLKFLLSAWDIELERATGNVLNRLDSMIEGGYKAARKLDPSRVLVDATRRVLAEEGLPDEWRDDDIRTWAIGWTFCQLSDPRKEFASARVSDVRR
jgi:hypothetical protein